MWMVRLHKERNLESTYHGEPAVPSVGVSKKLKIYTLVQREGNKDLIDGRTSYVRMLLSRRE